MPVRQIVWFRNTALLSALTVSEMIIKTLESVISFKEMSAGCDYMFNQSIGDWDESKQFLFGVGSVG